MERTNLESDSCPIARSLDVVGEWWSLLILREAFLGTKRFSEFQKNLGVAKNVLTSRLRKLVAKGVLEVVPASDGSAYSEYALTEMGKSIFPVIVALRQWSNRYLFEPGDIAFELVEIKTGEPVEALALRSKDGAILSVDDVKLVLKSSV